MNNLITLAFLQNINAPELLIIGLISMIWIVPFWMIFKKAGFHPALSLLMVFPFINVILFLYLAFAKWPALKK
jgi:hypothetical protein